MAAALTAGGLVAVHVALLPTMRNLPDGAAVRLHQVFDPLIHRYMPATTVGAGLAVIALLYSAPLEGRHVTLLAAGLANTILTILISQFLNVPINRTVRSWSPEAVPAEYHPLRRTWSRYNLVRTLTSLFALACYTVVAVTR
jgi:uncharacterized membrane protein